MKWRHGADVDVLLAINYIFSTRSTSFSRSMVVSNLVTPHWTGGYMNPIEVPCNDKFLERLVLVKILINRVSFMMLVYFLYII